MFCWKVSKVWLCYQYKWNHYPIRISAINTVHLKYTSATIRIYLYIGYLTAFYRHGYRYWCCVRFVCFLHRRIDIKYLIWITVRCDRLISCLRVAIYLVRATFNGIFLIGNTKTITICSDWIERSIIAETNETKEGSEKSMEWPRSQLKKALSSMNQLPIIDVSFRDNIFINDWTFYPIFFCQMRFVIWYIREVSFTIIEKVLSNK